MTRRNLTKTSLLAASVFSSVAALALVSPAIAEPASGVRVAQGAPAPQLTEDEKKRIEDLKKKRLERQGAPVPPPALPNAPPAPVTATPPPVVPAKPVTVPTQPAVVPRVVNPSTPPNTPPPTNAPSKAAPPTTTPATTATPAPVTPPDAGGGDRRLRRNGLPPTDATAPPRPAQPAPTATTPPPAVNAPPPPSSTTATPPPPATTPPVDANSDRRMRRNGTPPVETPAQATTRPAPTVAPTVPPPTPPPAQTTRAPIPSGAAAGATAAGTATAVVPPPPPPAGPAPRNLDDAKSGRTERAVKFGNRNGTVIQESDRRTIVRQGNTVVIQKDEAAQLQRVAPGARVSRSDAGVNSAVVERPNNVQIITETDNSGQLLRRYRRDGSGRETAIIDNRNRKSNFGRNLAIGVGVGAGIVAGAAILNSVVNVPPPRVRVPRDKYIVRYEDASEEDVYEALSAPPVDEIDRRYTLDEVRATHRLRERMRRVDLDDINFEFGSWEVSEREYGKLERIARAMKRVISRNPNEVFLIEGYTDAVGSDVDNLTLSDRRAEAVSIILSEQFDVPFENLTTQGYGEQYLKVDTDGPEIANRRVAVRRITPLLAQSDSVAAPPPPRRNYDDYRRYYDDDRPYRRWRRYNRYRDGY
jgi:outer membrane protein OmpA-like peptidoglycan-associated protein